MSRQSVALYITDVSAFAKTLRGDWIARTDPPGHLALLGMIARAAGYANYQHLRGAAPPPPPDPALAKRLDRALRNFDPSGRMIRWPGQTALQGLCLWVFWSRFPRREMSETEVNTVLKDGNLFGDHVLLRRSLIDHGLVRRTQDGATYARIEQPPPPEALELIRRAAPQRP